MICSDLLKEKVYYSVNDEYLDDASDLRPVDFYFLKPMYSPT